MIIVVLALLQDYALLDVRKGTLHMVVSLLILTYLNYVSVLLDLNIF